MSSDDIANGLTAAALVDKWKRNPDSEQRQNAFNLRMRRATSWLSRAEQELNVDKPDYDAAFIFYWIAFNAIYTDDSPETYDLKESEKFADYFSKVADLDANQTVFNVIWKEHNRSIRDLLDNQFVYKPFWQGARDWQTRFENDANQITCDITSKRTNAILVTVFERLYVLRNQLIHGGATWKSTVNREQVEDGAAIMAFLVPHFINLMLDNHKEDWNQPPYSPERAWRQLGWL